MKKKFKEWKKSSKIVFISGMSVLGIIAFGIWLVGSYLIYVIAQYYRLPDKMDLTKEIIHNSENQVKIGEEYKITTYNIGFGAYERDYDFFLDEGELLDGTKTVGRYSKAKSKESARRNTDGAIKAIADTDSDFVIMQEVDLHSDRCYDINQYDEFNKVLKEYDSNFAINFHSANFLYPFSDMMGAATSGLATYSRFNMTSAMRRSYPVSNAFPAKLFDLDRCFSVTRFDLENGKQLVIGNSHMSAYDEGNIIKGLQMEMINEFFEQEKDNYVIFGGDFNHDIAETTDPNDNTYGYFKSGEKRPNWVGELKEHEIAENYKIAASRNTPSCRSTDIPYTRIYDESGDMVDEEGKKYYLKNYTVSVDGFFYSSDKIECVEVINDPTNTDFMYSDHNPVTMTFC